MLGFRRVIRPHLRSAWRLNLIGLAGLLAALSGLRLPVHAAPALRVVLQLAAIVLAALALWAVVQAPRMGAQRLLRLARAQVLLGLALVTQALVLLLR